jgi:ATP citrate (pro-S)-lyase
MVNFASFRSAYDVTLEAMKFPCIKTIAIIAEGIPENLTRKLILAANEKEVTIIGKELPLNPRDRMCHRLDSKLLY